MNSGYVLAYKSRENTSCYAAGDPATLLMDVDFVLCPAEGGKFESLDWALPGSENGVSVTCFEYQRAIGAYVTTKPRADAQKVLTVSNVKNGGSYIRFLVPDSYIQADYATACCAGCDPLPVVTIPPPIIFYAECTLATPTIPGCIYKGAVQIAALTGANTTWTATAYGYDAAGVAIVFAPATSTGTTVALLAANMQTNWASELGSGTFVATGNNIEFTSTNGARVGFTIAQS